MDLRIIQRTVPHYNRNPRWGWIDLQNVNTRIGEFNTTIDVGQPSQTPQQNAPQSVPQQAPSAIGYIRGYVSEHKAPNKNFAFTSREVLPETMNSLVLPTFDGIRMTQRLIKKGDTFVGEGVTVTHNLTIPTDDGIIDIFTDGTITIDDIETPNDNEDFETFATMQEIQDYYDGGGKKDTCLSVFIDVEEADATDKEKEVCELINGRYLGRMTQYYRCDDSGIITYYVPKGNSYTQTDILQDAQDSTFYILDKDGQKVQINDEFFEAGNSTTPILKGNGFMSVTLDSRGNVNLGGKQFTMTPDGNFTTQEFVLGSDDNNYIQTHTISKEGVVLNTANTLIKEYKNLTQVELREAELYGLGYNKQQADYVMAQEALIKQLSDRLTELENK